MLANIIYGYFLCINLLALCVCGWDKRAARRGHWRVPERTLLLLCFLGGSPGMLFGMYVFRHKTKHKKFTLGVPAILLAQCGAAAAALYFISH